MAVAHEKARRLRRALRRLRAGRLDPSTADQRDHRDDQEDDEQDPGNVAHGTRKSGEPEDRGDDGKNEEQHGIVEHGLDLSLVGRWTGRPILPGGWYSAGDDEPAGRRPFRLVRGA